MVSLILINLPAIIVDYFVIFSNHHLHLIMIFQPHLFVLPAICLFQLYLVLPMNYQINASVRNQVGMLIPI